MSAQQAPQYKESAQKQKTPHIEFHTIEKDNINIIAEMTKPTKIGSR